MYYAPGEVGDDGVAEGGALLAEPGGEYSSPSLPAAVEPAAALCTQQGLTASSTPSTDMPRRNHVPSNLVSKPGIESAQFNAE